jgi:hypothetical protein
MRGTVRGTTYGYSLWEFEVYGSSTTATSAAAPGLKPVPASEEENTLPEENVLISPNPASSRNLTIRIYSDKVEDAIVSVLTHSSQPVATVRKTLAKGLNVIPIKTGITANGLYFISVRQGNKQLVKKVIIQN